MTRAWRWCFAVMALAAAACTTPPAQDSAREPRANTEPADPARRAAVRLELATAYYERRQYETALGEIRQALAAKPDLPDAYNLRGLVEAAMGDGKQAEASFQRALQLAPGDAGTMHNYGWFLCQTNRLPEAEVMFGQALAQPQYRDGMRTQLALGVCQARAGRWADAERTLSRSYELDPSNPFTAFNLAEVLLHRGELERARFYVRRINIQPEQVSAQSLWLAARIERRMGNFDTLQDIGRQMRERFPQAPETLLFDRGRFDD